MKKLALVKSFLLPTIHEKPFPGVMEILFVVFIFGWHLLWSQLQFVDVVWNTIICALYFVIKALGYHTANFSATNNILVFFAWPIIITASLFYLSRWIIYFGKIAKNRFVVVFLIVIFIVSLFVLLPNSYVLKTFSSSYYVWGYF
jgi:hypothetical protein